MYPFNSNDNTTSPIFYTLDQTIPYNKPYHSPFDIIPNRTQEEDPPSYLFSFPSSPYIQYEDDIVLRQHLHHDLLINHPPPEPEAPPTENIKDSIKNGGDGERIMVAPRKKVSKKDRHSKIETAQGPRDRRMRLSLEVAPQFFGLQDMLGFDKASKTVGWLLSKSRNAIRDLKKGFPNVKNSSSFGANSASSSECEVLSGLDEFEGEVDRKTRINKGKKPLLVKEKKISPLRKSATKESREKARARARERTREKKMLNEPRQHFEVIDHDMNQLVSWSPFDNVEDSGGPSNFQVEELGSSIFNYNGISQEHQFNEFQGYGRLWEGYDN